jgi:general secretion pathway protein B
MSYILDALKKAERERGAKQSPVLLTANDPQATRRSYRVPVAGGLLVCAIAAAWFFMPGRTRPVRTPVSPAVNAEHDQAGAESAGKSAPRRVESSPVTPSEGIAPLRTGDPRANPSTAPHEFRADSQEKIVPNHEAPQKPPNDGRILVQPILNPTAFPQGGSLPLNPPSIPKEPPPALATDAPAAKVTIPPTGVAQSAPASLQEAVAKMTLSILVYYDDEAARKVYINGKKYIKGDLVEGLYLIESITPEGVILSYKGEKALLR